MILIQEQLLNFPSLSPAMSSSGLSMDKLPPESLQDDTNYAIGQTD